MPRSDSGRVLVEMDPSQKDELYSALTKDGLTLKDWFLRQATQYLRDRTQLMLFNPAVVAEEQALYHTKLGASPILTEKKKGYVKKSKAK